MTIKKIKSLAVLIVGIMLFSAMPVSAAELSTPETEIETEETQSSSSYIVKTLTYNGVTAVVGCNYTVSWDEGYAGWVNNASFICNYAVINKTEYTPTVYGTAVFSGSSAYQRYKINGSLYKFVLTVDEWGDVTLSMGAA